MKKGKNDERRELNILKLREICARIAHVDITLCLENLCKHVLSADELLEIIGKVGSDKLGICLDTGHLNIQKKNTQGEFIRKAGKYLKALHVHDNDGSGDQHILPFAKGNIKFKEVMQALKEIDYEGLFNFEIPGERRPGALAHAKVAYAREVYNYLMTL